ncbi:MAG: hypothetical protein WCP58_01230 [bacterium]
MSTVPTPPPNSSQPDWGTQPQGPNQNGGQSPESIPPPSEQPHESQPPPTWGQQPPANQVSPPPPPPPPPSWSSHESWQATRRHRHGGSGWIWGLGLLALGVIFLLQNLGIFTLNNWWAIFILIPAVGSFATMVSSIQERGRFTSAAGGSLIGGLMLTFVALIFFFSWDWGKVWPFFLIIIGIGALISALARRS